MRGSRGSAKWNGSWSESSAATSSCVRAWASSRPRRLHLLAQLDGLEGGELVLDVREEARVGDAAGDDRGGRAAGEVDGVLQRDERPVGVARARRSARARARRPSPRRRRRDASSPQVSGGAGSERPGARARRRAAAGSGRRARRGRSRTSCGRGPGPPWRTKSASSPAPRSVTCRRVSPTSTSIGAPYPRCEMSEQRTHELPGGWLPPAAPDPPAQRPSPFGEPRRPWWRRGGRRPARDAGRDRGQGSRRCCSCCPRSRCSRPRARCSSRSPPTR